MVLISDLNTERNVCQLQVIVTSRAWKSKFISLLYNNLTKKALEFSVSYLKGSKVKI